MVIEIPDNLSPRDRQSYLKIIPIVYAIRLYRTQKAAAEWLGISLRCLKYALHEHKDLIKELENQVIFNEYVEDPDLLEKIVRAVKRSPGYYLAPTHEMKSILRKQIKKILKL